ncbi:16S rRNA (cytidine1402-2'-O)-methyltransferase [Eubacterium ruminantium]|uniref:Ribosomal RNA small subunit methyltransferase I n=1 Tax=Eubacterium ruminantium TaxID=42322 RepID=A0A1T4N6H8_9FIRM|nr:16S rRNA (cytidine(1402)-2'-O)-methyltransferase [Eubacterium ruminantium]SCW52000.1 16S rRNA (cytidine1402-2'-O)-methyltransferase [Eubacterium ruminantium]SDM65003.1 16S rRNA (cytidine1402-2'-O)-methyltransferase [Eubacterium ruminantium]SJZ74781.1 16S rRNA (cytidine1402-2'-O)-methyltransferase [Eubacterium ruminantium]
MAGILYLVATPIGNLNDMTFRAVEVLRNVSLIAAEDTRNSIKLLNHFEIKTAMTSYHEFNKYDKADYLIGKLNSGEDVAVITDAGTPGISDPGEVLVEKCYEAGITVVPVPGACAAVNALIASGQPTRRFLFEAFLPTDKKERREILESLRNETRTIIIYEAPHRLVKTLEELQEYLGDRELTLCKELTKKHESFIKTTLSEAVNLFVENEPRGEFVLVIKGKSRALIEEEKSQAWSDISIAEHVEKYISSGMTKKEAIKKVAEDRNIPKREVYAETITL